MQNESWIWKTEPVSPLGELDLLVDSNWLQVNLLENTAINDELGLYDDAHITIQKTSNTQAAPVQEDLWKDGDWMEQKIIFPEYCKEGSQDKDDNMRLVNPAKVLPQRNLSPLASTSNSPLSVFSENYDDEFDLIEEIDEFLNSNKILYDEIQPKELTAGSPLQTINQTELQAIKDQENLTFSNPNINNKSQTLSYLLNPCSQDIHYDNQNKADNENNEFEYDVDNIKSEKESIASEESMDNDSESSCSSNSKSIEFKKKSSDDDPDWSACRRSNKSRKYKRTEPYVRKPYVKVKQSEKKDRKKQQNKEAATRYREKKKQEYFDVIFEEKKLQDKNNDLKEKVKDLEKEVKMLKDLLRKLYTTKGLLK